MKISTNISAFTKHFTDTQIVDLLSEAGFDAIDYSFFEESRYCPDVPESEYKARFCYLREYAESKGMYFNQAHAPYPSSLSDENFTKRRFDELVTSIKNASFLGIRNIVVHPMQHLSYYTGENTQKLLEMNISFYKSLMPVCEEYGITVCTENMWQCYGNSERIWHSTCASPEEFAQYIDSVSSKYLKACVDIGHTVLVGENPEKMIKYLGERVVALHVHDNDGSHDSHTLPFFGIIKWDEVARALKQISYSGEITLESQCFIPKDLPTHLLGDSARYMAKVAKSFANMVEMA